MHGMSSAGDSSSGGAASPLTARSMRLERVAQALAHSQEELRRYVICTFYFSSLFCNFLERKSAWMWLGVPLRERQKR